MNKKILWIFVILFLSSFSFALTTYKNPTGNTFIVSSATYLNCENFKVNISSLIPYNVSSGSACEKYGIYNFTGQAGTVGASYMNCTRSGNQCVFNQSSVWSPVKGNEYLLCVIPLSNCDTAYDTAVTYPVQGSSLNWTRACYDNSGTWDCGTTGARGGIFDFWLNFTEPVLSITHSYPLDTQYFLNNYSGYINFTTNYVSNCTINNTKWSNFTSNGTLFGYLNNTKINPNIYSINVSCSNGSETTFSVLDFTANNSMNWTLQFPYNNTQYSSTAVNFWSNYTSNSTNTTACLYLDTVLVGGQCSFFNAGMNNATKINVLTGDQQVHYFYWEFYDGLNTVRTSNYTFYIDSVLPTHTSTFQNNSAFKYNTNLTADFTFSDGFSLFSYNVSVNGNQKIGFDNLLSLSNTTTLRYNTSNATIGLNTINIRYADGHTAKELKEDYIVNTGWLFNNELEYQFRGKYEEGNVRIKGLPSDIFDEFTTERQTDRYVFKYKPEYRKTEYEFEVESTFPIFVVEANDTYLKRWLVMGEHWMDFYIPSEPYSDVEFTKLTDTKIKVKVKNININTEEIQFNSIGDLNIVYVNYTFFVYNSTETFINPVVETSTNRFSLNVTYNASYTTDINANLFYNGTFYVPTKTTSSSYIYFYSDIYANFTTTPIDNRSFYWNFSVNDINGTTKYNTTLTNQSIHQMIITNCSTFGNNYTINFSYYEELSLSTKVNATEEGLVYLWYSDTTKRRNYSVYYYASDTFSTFCIKPDFVSLYADLEMNFEATNYDTESYLSNSLILNTSTQQVNIYFINSSLSTEITIFVLDQYSNPVTEVIVEGWKFNPVTLAYTLVEFEETDIAGRVKLDLYTTDAQYKFIVKRAGVSIYESETFKLFATEYTLRIGTTPLASLPQDIIGNLNFNLTYNQTSRNVTLRWNDAGLIANLYYLEAYNITGNLSNLLSSQTSSSNSGTLVYNVPNANGSYTVNFYLNYSGNGVKYYVTGLTINERREYSLFDTESLIMSLFFIGTMTFIGIKVSMEVSLVLSLFSFIIMYVLGFINLGVVGGGVMSIVILYLVMLARLQRK